MKMIRFIISLFTIVFGFSFQIHAQEAIYIYRNDGQFNCFFIEDVKLISYSCINEDGTIDESASIQEVHTIDSIYRIPLASIDSIGFLKPKTILKPEVKDIAKLFKDYIEKCEGKYIYLSSSIPEELLPKNNDKILSLEMDSTFPAGFAGEVVSITKGSDNYIIECSQLNLEDVVDSYCHTIDVYSTDNDNYLQSKTRGAFDPITISIPTLSYSWGLSGSLQLGDAAFTVSNTIGASLKPIYRIKGTDIVDKEHGRLTALYIEGDYTTGITYDFSIGASISQDYPFPLGRGERPIAPFLSFFWDFGLFVGSSGNVCYNQTISQRYKSLLIYQRYGNEMPEIYLEKPMPISSENNVGRLCLKGSVYGGVYGEIGIKPWLLDKDSNIGGKVSGRVELGVEAEMERGINLTELKNADKSTALYDIVDNAGDLIRPSLTISPYASLNATIKIGPWDTSWLIWKGQIGEPLYKGGFFPHFEDTDYEWLSQSSIELNSNVSRTCPFPFQIGFSLFDKDGNKIDTKYYEEEYRYPYTFHNYPIVFENVNANKDYKAYPCIKVFNYDVLASPSVEVEKEEFPVKIVSVEMKKASYYPNHYTYNNKQYSFKYNCSTTISLNEVSNVIDWGYIYIDMDGNESEKISLKNYSGTISDSRYAYCRNEASSTVKFKCYVQYEDDDNIYYGEEQEFSIEYPSESSISMSNCTYQGTENNVSYQGKTYKYKTTYRYLFSVTGAYWLKVATDESGNGWSNWNNLPDYTTQPVDGNNALTVNYYYDDKDFEGDYIVRLKASDSTHADTKNTVEYVQYTYSTNQFTGCIYNANGTDSRNIQKIFDNQEEEEEEYNIYINKHVN